MKTPTQPTQPTQPTVQQPPISIATMLNKQDVSKALGVSVRTLDNLVASRAFPPGARIGRHLFWAEGTVTAWHQRMFAGQLNWLP